jgi:hypothetical protein
MVAGRRSRKLLARYPRETAVLAKIESVKVVK